MIFMGNYPNSAAECYNRVFTLIKLQEKLGGIQQLNIGPHSAPETYKSEMEEFREEANDFIKQLKEDFLK